MSVYSGFASRSQETVYNQLTEDLISLLTWRVISAVKGEILDEEEWSNKLISITRKMTKLELTKYHPPKLSRCCFDLVHLFDPQPLRKTSKNSSMVEDMIPGGILRLSAPDIPKSRKTNRRIISQSPDKAKLRKTQTPAIKYQITRVKKKPIKNYYETTLQRYLSCSYQLENSRGKF